MIVSYKTGAEFLQDNQTYLQKNPYLSTFFTLDAPLLQEAGILDDASNAYGDQVCCAITPRMREALINDERLQKADFGFASLRKTNGALDPVMGIQFVVSPNLPLDESGNIICPMWMKNSLYFGSWKQSKVTVEKRTDKEDTIQIGLKTIMGSTRMREEAFVQIKCKPLS